MRLQIESARKVFFEGRAFYVFDNVYEPAEDTFLLAENLDANPDDVVLDLGTGCGILAILSALKARRVIATDINPYAVRCAKLNGIVSKASDRMDVVRGDLFGPIKEDGIFDLILFNAPYLPTEGSEQADWIDYAWAGGERGRTAIDRFISSAPRYLKPKGRILLVQSTLSNVNETIEKLERQTLWVNIIDEKKVAFETIILIEAKKNS